MIKPIYKVLHKLNQVQKTTKGWSASCPLHGSENSNLLIKLKPGGKVLMHCRAGCTTDQICGEIGIEVEELSPELHLHQPRFVPQRIATKKQNYFGTASAVLNKLEGRLGKHSHQWPYHNLDGECVGITIQWDCPEKGSLLRQISKTGSGWASCAMPAPRPLYRLRDLKDAKSVVVADSEVCADKFFELGFASTTSCGGASAARKSDWSPLSGKEVVFCSKDDPAGQKYIDEVTSILQSLPNPAHIRVLQLPEIREGEDLIDWIEDQWWDKPKALLMAKIKSMIEESPIISSARVAKPESKSMAGGNSQAAHLLQSCQQTPLCLDNLGRAFAVVPVESHRETIRVDGSRFRDFLISHCLRDTGLAPSDHTLSMVVRTLQSRARFGAPRREVQLRVAESNGAYWFDLCNDNGDAVRITADGWSITRTPDFLFHRSPGLRSLPLPQPGGRLEDFAELLSLDSETWDLLKIWLMTALHPRCSHPILFLHGEQGTGKTTAARMIKSLIDPSSAGLRSTPRNEQEMAIGVDGQWLPVYDNLSTIPDWFSDALCRLSTGGGLSYRELFSNDSEVLFEVKRPAIINGIEDFATREDLLSRGIIVTLSQIADESRMTEMDLWNKFNQLHPSLLGALMDAIVCGLQHEANVATTSLPRMADAAKWVIACSSSLGMSQEQVETTFANNNLEAQLIAVEASPVANAILAFTARNPNWTGTAAQLLEALVRVKRDLGYNGSTWPKSPSSLSGRLRRLSSSLLALGVLIRFERESGGNRTRLIRLSKLHANAA